MSGNSPSLFVELYRDGGATARSIDAYIDEKGQFVVSGQDVGEMPRAIWGDDDYEFWVTVAREHKTAVVRALVEDLGVEHVDAEDRVPPGWSDAIVDRELLRLIERKYKGVFGAVDAFGEFARARGIPVAFDTWV